MELAGYLAAARRWWWTLLVATWVAALAGYVVASQIAPTYEARTKLLVGPINTDIDTLRAAGQLVQTYAELVTSQPLLESTIAELGLDESAGGLRAGIRATADDVSRFLTIRVQDEDPAQAAAIADTLANELIQLTGGGTSRPEGQLQVTEFAEPPETPVAPQISILVILAAAAGFVGALILALLVEYLTNAVRSEDDLARVTDLAVLGTAPRPPDGPPAALTPEAEAAHRMLASRVMAHLVDTGAATVAVVGVEEGTSGLLATDLALALASGGRRVVLVDGAGEVDARFGLGDRPGLGELVRGSADPADVAVPLDAGISLIPRGAPGEADLAGPDRAGAVLDTLARLSDSVVVAGGPTLGGPAALAWVRVSGATVLVAMADHSRRDASARAAEALRDAEASIVGVALLSRRRRRGRPLATRPVEVAPALAPAFGTASGTRPGRASAAGPSDDEAPPRPRRTRRRTAASPDEPLPSAD